MKWIFIVLGIVAFTCVYAQFRGPSAKNWQKDLLQLQEALSTRHVDLYHSVSKESFDQAVDSLYQDIPGLTTPQILVRIAQLVAMVGDGHTSFYPGNQKRKWFKFYPIKFWAFSDGIYVIGAENEHVELLGKKLVGIDETPIEKVLQLVATTTAADNPMEYTYTAPFELVRPELLHSLGISKSSASCRFEFEDGTQKILSAIALKKWRNLDWRSASVLHEGKKPISMRPEAQFATDLTIEQIKNRSYYWYTYLEKEQAMYFQYNVCWDQKDRPSFEAIAKRLFQQMDSLPVERLIVDVRQNSGGEPAIAEPLIAGLAERKTFTREGRLFVITGRRTYSAALTNAAHLRSRARARVVGEHSRGKPNNPSEGRDIDLKRTKIWVSVSTQFVERDSSLGDSPYLPVDIPVPYPFSAFEQAEDPYLKAALRAEIFKSD